MKDSEAIENLKCYRAQSGTSYPEEIEMAIKALEEVQPYRAIGTVEECRAAVEKQKPIKVKGKYKSESPEDIECYGEDAIFADCPICGQMQNISWNSSNCGDCGQKLDWSDEE